MTIEKRFNHLVVTSNIYFDEKACFCGRPYLCLVAYKEKSDYGWESNQIGIAIHDNDDFDIGLVYTTDTEHFDIVLHELVNWMRDHEQGESIYHDIWDPFNFFLDCGCKREIW